MTGKIGTQTGIEATRLALAALDPVHKPAYYKLLGEPGVDYGFGPVEGTLKKLVAGPNELLDRVAALEARAPVPFPASGPGGGGG